MATDLSALFPLLDNGSAKLLSAAVAQIEAAKRNGNRIPNPAFVEAKSRVNRVLERAFDAAVTARFHNESFRALPQAEQALAFESPPQVHTLAAWDKRLAKTRDPGPVTTAAREFVELVRPLVADLAALTPVKRETKADSDPYERYRAPTATLGAIGQVRDILTDATDQVFDDIVEQFAGFTLQAAESYAALLGNSEMDPKLRKAKLRDMRQENPILTEIVDEATHALKGGAKARVQAQARIEAEAARTQFVYKNLEKLDSIVAGKGDFERVEIASGVLNVARLEGALRFSFRDGSSFVARNEAVFVVNQHGTRFYRYPLTFHDAVLRGIRLQNVNEKVMNEVFAAPAAEAEDEADAAPGMGR